MPVSSSANAGESKKPPQSTKTGGKGEGVQGREIDQWVGHGVWGKGFESKRNANYREKLGHFQPVM